MQTRISIKLIYYFSKRYPKYYFDFNNDRSYVRLIAPGHQNIRFALDYGEIEYLGSSVYNNLHTFYMKLINRKNIT